MNATKMLIGISQGMSGHYAVMYNSETCEPEQTGIGRYATAEEAIEEAISWSECEDVSLDSETYKAAMIGW